MNAAIITRTARRGRMSLNIVGQINGSKVALRYHVEDLRDGGSIMGCMGEFADAMEANALANRMVAAFGCGDPINTVK